MGPRALQGQSCPPCAPQVPGRGCPGRWGGGAGSVHTLVALSCASAQHVSLFCLAVSASPQPGEFASGCCSEAPEGTAASGWGESPRGEGWLWLPGASPPHNRAGPPASLVNGPQDEQRPTLGSRAPKLGCSKTKSQSKAGPHTATSR